MSIWHHISNVGIHDGLAMAFRKRIVLANRIILIAITIITFYAFLFLSLGNHAQAYADMVILALLGLCYLLMHQRRYAASRLLFCMVATTSVFVGTDSTGSSNGKSAVFMYYTTVALTSMLIFTPKEWKLLAFAWLVNAGVYLGTFFYPNLVFTNQASVAPEISRMLYIIDLVISLLANSYIVFLLAKSGDANETKLGEALDISNKQREDLQATKRDLQEAVEEIMAREEELRQNHDELMAVNDHLLDAQKELQTTIEQLKTTQNSLVQSEKMAALGQLVAGVAHEINTPIGVAVTAASTLENTTNKFVEIAQTGQMKKSDLTQYVTDAADSSRIILRNLERASELVRSFKQVAVNTTHDEMVPFSVGQTIDEIISSLKPELRKTRVEVETEVEPGLKLTSIPGALSQILINFVTNSLRYAFDDQQPGVIRILVQSSETGIRLIFSDNGKGIAPENLSKVFDPFFTTGRSIGGTGLGLNIVYNLVTQKLGGQLHVESTLGVGTTFYLNLPHMS